MSSVRAKRSFGQNFLQDQAVIRRIVTALDLKAGETVIEIGPGEGALTAELLRSDGQLIAVEADRDLIPALRSRFRDIAGLDIVNDDALTISFAGLLTGRSAEKAKLVANLPYNISTPILQRLMLQRHLFSRLVLMFQKEVVERITAKPGTSDRGYLSVLVENAFETEYLFDVPPAAFRPVPKVWSAVVRLTPKLSAVSNEAAFQDLVSTAFRQKRKTLLNNLKESFENAGERVHNAGIDPRRRAETLSLDEWVNLTNIFK